MSVAVIGGGISGLSCAQTLQSCGIPCVVFDTGKRAVGGRASTRYFAGKDGFSYAFDHSAQFITASSELFQTRLNKWTSEGSLQRWEGPVGTIDLIEGFKELEMTNRYVGVRGIKSLSDQLTKDLEIRRATWVSRLERSTSVYGATEWNLYEHSKHLGKFSAVIIAHNGKCADRLISTSNVPRINNVLKVAFGAQLPAGGKLSKKMQLCSLWVAIFAIPASLHAAFEGAYVMDSDVLSWVCNNSKKLRQPEEAQMECWTLISTREFGAANKVPQENIPPEAEKRVKQLMLAEFERVAGLQSGSINPPICKLQLWGAAVPLNRYNAAFALDGPARIGVCGDWFSPHLYSLEAEPGLSGSAGVRGPSIESAFLSGHTLALELARGMNMGGMLADYGLESSRKFEACPGHPLGDVPVPSVAGHHTSKGIPLPTRAGHSAHTVPHTGSAGSKATGSTGGERTRHNKHEHAGGASEWRRVPSKAGNDKVTTDLPSVPSPSQLPPQPPQLSAPQVEVVATAGAGTGTGTVAVTGTGTGTGIVGAPGARKKQWHRRAQTKPS